MDIIYISKEYLYCLNINELKNIDLSVFFSGSKNRLVYIEDNNKKLLGYVDHRHYKNRDSSKIVSINLFKNVLERGCYITNFVDHLFEHDNNLNAIPVVDEKNVLLGAYVKSYPEELSSNERVMNTIALSVLPAFTKELCNFFFQNQISTLYIISSDEDYNEIKTLLSTKIKIKRYCGCHYNNDFSLIVDMQYSKSYRESLLKKTGAHIISLEDLLSQILLPIAINFVKNRGAKLLFIEGPLKERIHGAIQKWPQLYSNITLTEAINNEYLLNTFYNGNLSLIEWSKDKTIGILAGDDVCTNGIHLLMSRKLSEFARKDESPTIYLYGPCLCYGACVPEEYRINRVLKKYCPEYDVINNGVKNGRSILNDILYILDTNVQSGDILVDINVYSSLIKDIIENNSTLYDFNMYFNRYLNLKCQFLDNTFHANPEVTYIVAKYISSLVTYNTNNIKEKFYLNYLQESKKINKINSQMILRKSLMNSYVEYLKMHKRVYTDNQVVGSVILTANPLTKGHEFLIKSAKSKCDLLYVFIVEQDSFEFSTSERMDLVRSVIVDRNIVILSSGKVMTARYTFPDYYQKCHSKTEVDINPMSDVHFYLYASVVAPILGISKRFVGDEIKGSVTDYYNKKLQKLLPTYGIDLEIIPRLCDSNGSIISASKVREMIRCNEFDILSDLLSPYVYKYVIETRCEKLINKGRWSSTYKIGNCIIKRYKYYVPEEAKREAKASKSAKACGILTPKHIKTTIENGGVSNVFEFMDLSPINTKTLCASIGIYEQISSVISKLGNVNWDIHDSYWKLKLVPEFKDSINRIKIDTTFYFNFLDSLMPEVFIHGDLTCDNIALTNGKVVIYDFQHGCLGPKGWDKAYLASTIPYSDIKLFLNEEEKLMAEIISAVRYGRSIRKNFDIENRKSLFQSWQRRK